MFRSRQRTKAALPRPVHGGTRLTWDEVQSGFLPNWDGVGVIRGLGRPGWTAFRLTTHPGIWWKAVKRFNSAGALCQDLQCEEGRPSFGPAADFPIDALRGGLLVLAKAKFLGVHTDMYEVALDERTLAQASGSVWTFNWWMQ